MGNGSDGWLVSQARYQTAINDLEDAAFNLDRGIGGLIENPPHVAMALRRAMGLRRLMGRSDAGLMPTTELKKITYGVLRAGLLANYEERNNNIELRATGEETIGGLPALDSFFRI
jgi:hypothetical protein